MASRRLPAKIAWIANCKQISVNQRTFGTNATDIPRGDGLHKVDAGRWIMLSRCRAACGRCYMFSRNDWVASELSTFSNA